MGAIYDFFVGLFGGPNGGLTRRGLAKTTERDKFSSYLPWVAYDEKEKIYWNVDDTVGFAYELSPLYFAGESTIKTLEGIFRINVPDSAVMQFIFYADPKIDATLERYRNLKTRDNDVVQEAADRFTEFYREGASGLSNLGGIPLRDFRTFFTIKIAKDDAEKISMKALSGSVEEILRGSGLFPRPLSAGKLLDWMRRLMNDKASFNNEGYDDFSPLRRQVLLGTQVKRSFTSMTFDSKHFRCMTPKSWPREVSAMTINQLFGGIKGLVSDPDQIRSPFLCTMNIVMADQKQKLHTKCNFILKQQAVGSFAASQVRKQEEYLWAMDEMERGTKFLRIIPTMWVHADDEWLANESLTRAKRVWESYGFVMQEDKGILPILLISSLPFGLYNVKNNVNMIDRDFTVQSDTIATCLPIQADFKGFGDPAMLFVGRKGQLFGVDIFAKGANNHNFLCFAEPGAGKSVLINNMLLNYYGKGAKIRVIDIGGSYKKLVRLVGARYLEFDSGSDVRLNPFTNVSQNPDQPEDTDTDIAAIIPIVLQMCFSAGRSEPTQLDVDVIKDAVHWAWNQEGCDACVDTVYAFLEDFETIMNQTGEIAQAATRLAYSLKQFTSEGTYGKFFNGPATFDISRDDAVVLELEHLIGRPALASVIILQVINAVTQDLYLSDRSEPRLIVFDEAYHFLNDSSAMADVIEVGFRRARKYSGSFGIISQGITDLKQFGKTGEVLKNSAAFKFYLESTAFESAAKDQLIDYDSFTMDLLKSVKSNKPHYSEVFMDTPFGNGVGRLVLDPFSYYVYTSDGKEVAEIESMVDGGLSYAEAINAMVARYRS